MEKSLIEKEDEEVYNTPQKWYIRKKWVEHALIRKSRISSDNLKILTLTCCEVYEIKYFIDNGIILMNGNTFDENLTFCEKAAQRFALIQKKLPGARSHYIAFEDFIISHDTTITGSLNKWFPFDIINLDFNECVFKQRTKFFNAIKKLFIIQKMKKSSFNLFLTINLIANEHHSSSRVIFDELLENNIRTEELTQIRETLQNIKFDNYNKYISCLVPKFIIEEGFKNNFDVKLQESMIYVGEGNITQMISLVFDITFHETPRITLPPSLTINRILEIVKDPQDINSILEFDSSLMQEMQRLVEQYKS